LQTLGPQDIAPPALNWKRRETNWWDNQGLYTSLPDVRDIFNHWPVPLGGWKPGHLASVPSFITPDQRQCVRVKSSDDPEHVFVEFPVLISEDESPIVFMYYKEDVIGPHKKWEFDAFTWHKSYKDVPAVNAETAIAALDDDNEQDDTGLPPLDTGGELEEDGEEMPPLDLGPNAIMSVDNLLIKEWVLSEPKIPSNQSDVLQQTFRGLGVHGSSRDDQRGCEDDFDVNGLFADGDGK
jgi:hypothetical protein